MIVITTTIGGGGGSLSISAVNQPKNRHKSQGHFSDVVVNISESKRHSFNHFDFSMHAFGKGIGEIAVKVI